MGESQAGNASSWVAGTLPGSEPVRLESDDGAGEAKIRVAHVGTGRAGTAVLRSILTDPRLELVGLWATSPEDVGRDAGELAGRDPAGVAASDSLEAALAGRPDVLCHCGHGQGREHEVVRDSYFALERGVNVITTSLFEMIMPEVAPAELRRPLKDAAILGQVSFMATGLNPGFATDLLPSALLAVSDTVTHLDVREIGYYDRYDAESVIRGVMGFGQLPDQPTDVFNGPLVAYCTAVVHQLAAHLGLDVDEVLISTTAAVHHADVHTAAGMMKAGTVVARRLSCEGRSGDRAVINTDHVTRVTRGVAENWPQFDGAGEVNYRVSVTGEPTVCCELSFGGDADAPGPPAASVQRVVDLIPALVAARVGVLSAMELVPAVTGRSLATRGRLVTT